jgi:hypothetical protein
MFIEHCVSNLSYFVRFCKNLEPTMDQTFCLLNTSRSCHGTIIKAVEIHHTPSFFIKVI